MPKPCKSCGLPVDWKKLQGRWHCFNLDGVSHWDTCSQERWRQVKATGELFEEKGGSTGYRKSVHGTRYERIMGKTRTGANYRMSDACLNCVPPWEACPMPECPIEFPTGRTDVTKAEHP